MSDYSSLDANQQTAWNQVAGTDYNAARLRSERANLISLAASVSEEKSAGAILGMAEQFLAWINRPEAKN